MSIALIVITDGRDDYLNQCTTTLDNLHGPITERWMYDDTGDQAYRAELAARFPTFNHINAGPRQGFGGAMRAAWAHLLADSMAEHIFHVEQDFTFPQPINLPAMVRVLDAHPELAQMALRRQAWNHAERAAGGIVEQHPDAYTDRYDYALDASWLEHRMFFTTNPSIYRRSLMTVGWPDCPRSEGMFTAKLLADGTPEARPDEVRFGYWGRRYDNPAVAHIGYQRTGTGY